MALEFAAGVDLPWLLDLCLDWIPEDVARELEVILARFGLEPATRMTGMVAGALRPSSRPLPRLRFERITSPAQRLLASDLQSLAYDLPLDTCRMATESGAFWSEPESEFAYLGFDGDTAVTTATTIPLDGRLYAALVATHPEAQRRGYAEAVLRHSLAEARAATDLTPVDLHSSRAGFGVYSAMGFQPVATFAAFAPRG
jgi:GNAT superfamily N-acetyltransferase